MKKPNLCLAFTTASGMHEWRALINIWHSPLTLPVSTLPQSVRVLVIKLRILGHDNIALTTDHSSAAKGIEPYVFVSCATVRALNVSLWWEEKVRLCCALPHWPQVRAKRVVAEHWGKTHWSCGCKVFAIPSIIWLLNYTTESVNKPSLVYFHAD